MLSCKNREKDRWRVRERGKEEGEKGVGKKREMMRGTEITNTKLKCLRIFVINLINWNKKIMIYPILSPLNDDLNRGYLIVFYFFFFCIHM